VDGGDGCVAGGGGHVERERTKRCGFVEHEVRGAIGRIAEIVNSLSGTFPQRLKPNLSDNAYRSAEVLHHPKSNAVSVSAHGLAGGARQHCFEAVPVVR